MTATTVPCPHCHGTGHVPAPPARCDATFGDALNAHAHRCSREPGHEGDHVELTLESILNWPRDGEVPL